MTPSGWRRDIRPDIPLTIDDNNYIMDAKWKGYDGTSGRNDTFQLITYMFSYRAINGALVYPKRDMGNIDVGPTKIVDSDNNHVLFAFIDLRNARESMSKIICKLVNRYS